MTVSFELAFKSNSIMLTRVWHDTTLYHCVVKQLQSASIEFNSFQTTDNMLSVLYSIEVNPDRPVFLDVFDQPPVATFCSIFSK